MKNDTIDIKKIGGITKQDPIYIQIQDVILNEIENGKLLPGEKLSSERELAQELNLNRMTVKYAVNGLVDKGYLYRIQGKGTFVGRKNFEKINLGFINEKGNDGITALVKNQGVEISNKVLARGIVDKSMYLTDKLKIDSKDPVYALHRIRYGNGDPLAVEYTYLPATLFENINDIDFKYVSLYDYMDLHGHMPVIFGQKLQMISLGSREAKYLELSEGEPIYYFEFIGRDKNGMIVEYTESYERCDKTVFRFNAVI